MGRLEKEYYAYVAAYLASLSCIFNLIGLCTNYWSIKTLKDRCPDGNDYGRMFEQGLGLQRICTIVQDASNDKGASLTCSTWEDANIVTALPGRSTHTVSGCDSDFSPFCEVSPACMAFSVIALLVFAKATVLCSISGNPWLKGWTINNMKYLDQEREKYRKASTIALLVAGISAMISFAIWQTEHDKINNESKACIIEVNDQIFINQGITDIAARTQKCYPDESTPYEDGKRFYECVFSPGFSCIMVALSWPIGWLAILVLYADDRPDWLKPRLRRRKKMQSKKSMSQPLELPGATGQERRISDLWL